MGIHFFKNAAFGGDWIFQKKIVNINWLNELLPSNPPLSTMRVITWYFYISYDMISNYFIFILNMIDCYNFLLTLIFILYQNQPTTTTHNTYHFSSSWSLSNQGQGATIPENIQPNDLRISQYIRPLSSVLRLGRSNANTDHSSVLFDVDMSTGIIKEGRNHC